MINIKKMEEKDIEIISKAFKEQGWNKEEEIYQCYYNEQKAGIRLVLVAEVYNEFAGYLSLVYNSSYPHFKEFNITEIMDFNVLKKFQNMGVGTTLMDEAERLVGLKDNIVGLRVGLTSDYGNAQNLYINRGYTFDKYGISYIDKNCQYNDKVTINDDLVLGMTKKLRRENRC